jgi:hypothetical protein
MGMDVEVETFKGGAGTAVVRDSAYPGWEFRIALVVDGTVEQFDIVRSDLTSPVITRTALKRLPYGAYEREVRAAVHRLASAWAAGVRPSPETAAYREQMTQFYEQVDQEGRPDLAGNPAERFFGQTALRIAHVLDERQRPPARRRRGPQTRTPEWCAGLAADYVKLNLAGKPVYKTLAAQRQMTEQSVRNAIRKLRDDGYITPTIKGKKGGDLTEKAASILEQQGDD